MSQKDRQWRSWQTSQPSEVESPPQTNAASGTQEKPAPQPTPNQAALSSGSAETDPVEMESSRQQIEAKLQELKMAAKDDVLGLTLGNIRILKLIGEGGMGRVYLAQHLELDTTYAVKVLHPELSTDTKTAERFRREAMMSSRLRHPNIVFITDFGFHKQLGLYITMEYLDGQTLKQFLKTKPQGLGLWKTIRVVEQIAEALAMAHDMGVVHRDLKPENIFLLPNPGHSYPLVKVLDFGIARLLQEDAPKLTIEGHVLGTPYYIAPEQITGHAITPKTDVYALGVVLYEMLTGTPPFTGSGSLEIFSKHLMHQPSPLSVYRPELEDTQLTHLLTQMLAKSPDLRITDMRELCQQLPLVLQELQELGLSDAQETRTLSPSTSQTQLPVPVITNPSLHLSGVFDKINVLPDTSMLAYLYQAQHALSSLSVPLFFTASWSALLWDLIEHEESSEVFEQSISILSLMIKLLLQEADEPDAVPDALPVLQRVLRDLFGLADKHRQKTIMAAIQPMVSHHLFPDEFLPKWAAARTTGTWKRFKNVLNSDIRDLFGFRSKDDLPAITEETTPSEKNAEEMPRPLPMKTQNVVLPSTKFPASSAISTAQHPTGQTPKSSPKTSPETGKTQESLLQQVNKDSSLDSLQSLLSYEMEQFRNKKS